MSRSTKVLAAVFLAAAGLPGYLAAAQPLPAATTQAVALAPALAQEQTILFEVYVPSDAVLLIDGDRTASTGEYRRFQTLPLRVGGRYVYTLKATSGGKEVTRQMFLTHGAAN